MSYFVSRQFYYYQQINVVEIAYPSIDSSGPDMLIEKYVGEGEEYIDPREALDVALNIASAWQSDIPDEDIFITFGNMELVEGEPIDINNHEDIEELKKEVQKHYDSLPKCSYCGELIDEKEYFINPDSEYTEDKFCSEFHAEKAYHEGYDICRICEKDFKREDMILLDEVYFICEKCQEINDTYEDIDIIKINDNSFVGYGLKDQEITRSILGKTYLNREEFNMIKSNLNYISVYTNLYDINLKEID